MLSDTAGVEQGSTSHSRDDNSLCESQDLRDAPSSLDSVSLDI